MEGRIKLNEHEEAIIQSMKDNISEGINELLSNGVRKANIEIELMWHIKNTLKEE